MKISENNVAEHYSDGGLLDRILVGLEASGVNLDDLQPHELAPVEEFHIGGRKATIDAVEQMSLGSDHHVLDVGCGIGGAARYMADHTGCKVTGIDLTPEYVSVAQRLNELADMNERVNFEVASALDMPYEEATFDAAITLHVAMNIRERAGLYGEIARVLKPGSIFYLFDVMRKHEGQLAFPVPWAQSEDTSHLTTPDEMLALLDEAGFEVREVGDRTDFAIEFFRENMQAAASGSSPLGVNVVMGDSAAEKLGNVLRNIEAGYIAPVQMVTRRRGDV